MTEGKGRRRRIRRQNLGVTKDWRESVMCVCLPLGPTTSATIAMLLVLVDLQTPHNNIIFYNGPWCTGRKEGLG